MKSITENWIYLLAVNGTLLYGVLTLGWPVFPLVYLWWWEGLLSTIVSTSVGKWKGRPEAGWFQLFPYLIYFIFIVIVLGVVAAGEDQAFNNLIIIMLKAPLFNLCLLLLVLHLGFRVVRGAPPGAKVVFYQIRVHVGIVLGGLAIFVSRQLGIDSVLPVALTVLAVKFALDIWTLKSARETGEYDVPSDH